MNKKSARPRRISGLGPGLVLGVPMGVVLFVVVMVLRGGEGRTCKHHQQKNGGNHLLHGKNLARKERQQLALHQDCNGCVPQNGALHKA
jgi:hypothetical protein